MSLAHIFPWFGVVLTITVCAGAFWKGGREEQQAAAGLLLALAVTLAMRDRTWVGTQWGAFAADVCLFAFLTFIALRSKRYWPLAAAGFQLLGVATHLARTLDPGVRAWAYATGQVIWSQLVFWALAVGVFNTWRARRQETVSGGAVTEPGATRR
ncbi:MAG: hypothetical protein ACHP7A_01920 [Caulobacterales bacterium]